MRIKRKLKLLDTHILVPTIILAIIGIVMVYSAGSYVAINVHDNSQHFLIRQIIFLSLGVFLGSVVYFLNPRILQDKKTIMLAIAGTFFLLVFVLFFGEEVNGAKGWINFGPINIQPAEIAKLTVIWYLAYIFSKRQKEIVSQFKETVIAPITLVLGLVFLIMMQPDMGSAIIILGIAFLMILTSGVSLKVSFSLGGIGALLIAGIFFVVRIFGDALPFIQDYQLDRFQAFWDPFALSQTTGLQLVNSYYALSRGGLVGVGIGESVQKSGYLPEPQTDFIMAIIGEELGLIGVLFILIIYFYLISRIYIMAIRAKDAFNSLMLTGIGSMFLIQATVNLGGMIGLMPITGVTFPFISYGGSSLIISCISIAFALNIIAHEKRIDKKLEEGKS